MDKEVSHYVVTAHPPGSVLVTAKCNFLSPQSKDVLVAKSRRLEVRQLRTTTATGDGMPSPFPVALQVPINGRIVSLEPFHIASSPTSLIFFLTDNLRYAAIQYNALVSPYPIMTHASGSLSGQDQNLLGRLAESGPLVAMDPLFRCIALHIYDGLLTILPIHTHYSVAAVKSSGSGGHPQQQQVLGPAFHCRLEERTVLALQFVHNTNHSQFPQLVLLHQGSRGEQHLTSVVINLAARQLHLPGSSLTVPWIQKSMVDGGSALLVPVPPRVSSTAAASAAAAPSQSTTTTSNNTTGGILLLGQQQITYVSPTATKILPMRQALMTTFEELPVDPAGMPRYLLGDEFGNLHLLTVCLLDSTTVVALQRDTLGSCSTLPSQLAYLEQGLVLVGSSLGDSQLIQIHDEPIPLADTDNAELMDTTYLTVVEEYTQLGPILDFDLIPTTLGGSESGQQQSQVVTASGSSKSGSLRLIRNGIGMNEYAAVEIPGIQDMWSVRKQFAATEDAYLVQSFVGETRVLAACSMTDDDDVNMENDEEEEPVAGTLEEIVLPGLDSAASTLLVGNLEPNDCLLQITPTSIRVFAHGTGQVLDVWSSPKPIIVASANEAGQIAVALQGGLLVYLIVDNKINKIAEKQMEREVGCMDLHPLVPKDAMDDDNDDKPRVAHKSELLAVGLWDDFTVRLFSLDTGLEETLCIHLSAADDNDADSSSPDGATARRNRNNMMARSLCLVTLDLASSSSSSGSGNTSNQGVDMLFVGLGDGTLISFAVVKKKGVISVHSRKEVCLGTQRIDLVPLCTERGGTCVLATGDRPTVIYLAGLGGTSLGQSNPKLCYSNVNLAPSDDEEGDDVSRLPAQQSIAVNVASPFFSPLLFDSSTFGSQHYSLCVADDANLRLGVIDDIQKLHVTTCRLGMAPRRIVHCPDGRLFAVGCLESGIKHFGLSDDEPNMGNCIRFMDDTTFDDLEQVDLEPFEMILSMVYATMKVNSPTTGSEKESSKSVVEKPFLLVGTAYALANEDEPTRGRILVYTCQPDETNAATTNNSRAVRQVTEFSTAGGVYNMCQFYDGMILCTVNSKTMVCQLTEDAGMMRLEYVGRGHHGNILSLFVKSRAKRQELQDVPADQQSSLAMDVSDDTATAQQKSEPQEEEEKLAIVGDLMRSISLVQYYPEHKTLEEIARDFNGNWTTAIEMLHDNVYLGAENWSNLFCLRRNTTSNSEEIRCRLDTIGEFHLGEMCNKFMSGSLVMPVTSNNNNTNKAGVVNRSSSSGGGGRMRSPSPQKKKSADSPTAKNSATRMRRPVVVTGSQTLFGTVDGTLGVILGLDGRTTVYFSCLERAMAKVIRPVGDLDHNRFRAVEADRRVHPAHGFIDGDLVESFLDLDHTLMEAVVREMNRDGGWEVDQDDVLLGAARGEDKEDDTDSGHERAELSVDEVVAMVEEMTMLH